LIKLASSELKPDWGTGSAAAVQGAMSRFITNYWKDLLVHAPYVPTQKQEFRAWSRQFAQWLFSTDHISIRYEIAYDGVDIRKLSPGTRGIVLLLLYLALDDADDRPLIIDQPEENLDPKSVFDELVALFTAAKTKRQVIMVTHNANLVINTDADQIIIAEAGPQPAHGLPSITYVADGLEDADIRKAVCDILDGGEEAFRERARRLRVRLER
jgi:ATPase subunit of ABC transporter with duplicated ATPase domains